MCICFVVPFVYTWINFWQVICFVWSSVAQPNVFCRWPVPPNQINFALKQCWNGIMACALNACTNTHFDFGEKHFWWIILLRALAVLHNFFLSFFFRASSKSLSALAYLMRIVMHIQKKNRNHHRPSHSGNLMFHLSVLFSSIFFLLVLFCWLLMLDWNQTIIRSISVMPWLFSSFFRGKHFCACQFLSAIYSSEFLLNQAYHATAFVQRTRR